MGEKGSASESLGLGAACGNPWSNFGTVNEFQNAWVKCLHGGRSDSNLTPTPPLNFLGLGGGGGEGGSLGELGAASGGVPGTPTYIPQNDPLVALIISNTHMWGF